MSGQAPGLSSTFDGNHDSIPVVREFEERLEAVRRFEKDFSVIDYDAPVEAIGSSIGLGTKIGVGVAVVAFGLVFAFGDFLPSGSVKTTEAEKPVTSKLSEEERATLEVTRQRRMLGSTNFEILGGLTNALLAAKKPEEAVQVLMQARERLSVEQVNDVSTVTKGSAEEKRPQVDPIQGIILKENGNVGESERMFVQARFFAPEKAKALVDRYSRG